MAFTHQEDTESQERGEVVLPAAQGQKTSSQKELVILEMMFGCIPVDKRPQVAAEDS